LRSNRYATVFLSLTHASTLPEQQSGGPLLTAANVVVGIVSWGTGCAHAESPGVYARVSTAYGWITDQVCEMSNFPPAFCGPQPTPPPTPEPTPQPTNSPSLRPTLAPTNAPTPAPTNAPTPAPTNAPTPAPTNAPTPAPTIPSVTAGQVSVTLPLITPVPSTIPAVPSTRLTAAPTLRPSYPSTETALSSAIKSTNNTVSGIRIVLIPDAFPEELSFVLESFPPEYDDSSVKGNFHSNATQQPRSNITDSGLEYSSTTRNGMEQTNITSFAQSNSTESSLEQGNFTQNGLLMSSSRQQSPVVIASVTSSQLRNGTNTFTYTGDHISANQTYQFTLEDFNGNGWCCYFGAGRVEIYQVLVPENDPDTKTPLKSTRVYAFWGPFKFLHQGTFSLA